jgi:hypothetical protein
MPSGCSSREGQDKTMWYSFTLVNHRASLLGFFIGHARGGTLLKEWPPKSRMVQ